VEDTGFGDQSERTNPFYHPRQLSAEVIALDVTDALVSGVMPEFFLAELPEDVIQNLYPEELVQAGLCLAPCPYSDPSSKNFILICVACRVALNPTLIAMDRHFRRETHRQRTLGVSIGGGFRSAVCDSDGERGEDISPEEDRG